MCKRNDNLKYLGMVVAIAIIALIFAAQAAAANDPEVRVCAPDWTTTEFDVIVRMNFFNGGIKSLEGRFYLSFNTDVVELKSITGNKIGDKEVTIVWGFVDDLDNKKIWVEFTVPDDIKSTLTNGNIAKIHFGLGGDMGDKSLLDITGAPLTYTDGTVVSSVKWTDDTVNIGSFDVTVNAPEFVSTDTFDADIDITDVIDLDSAQLELSFDPGVVNVTGVKSGKIRGIAVPVDSWGFKMYKNDTIIVNINLPGMNGVSGSGTLATISFDVIGDDGDSSVLDIVEKSIRYIDSFVTNTESERLPVNWIDANVTIDRAPQPQNKTNTTASVETNTTASVKTLTTVFVKNLDDDKLNIRLFIDGVFKERDSIFSISSRYIQKYNTYELVEGLHTFKIKWYDHDTKQEHEKIEKHSVSGDTDVVVLYTVEHADKDTKISARVYVKNNDDDPVDVYLDIDGTYKKYETIEAGDTCDYKDDGYEFDEKESRTFKIRWIDPDTDIEYEKITRQYIDTAESVTMQVDLHTEDDLITTFLLASESLPPQQSSVTSRSASDTSARSGTVTSESQPPTTVFNTDPTSSGSGAGGSQPYHHIYTLVGVVAIVFAMMQIRRV